MDDTLDENPLLLENEKHNSSKLRWFSVVVCAALFLNGLQMLVFGLGGNTRDLISQDTPSCPAEPLLPSHQIKVGAWLCLATMIRMTATMLAFFIFTQIYYGRNNQSFNHGKCFFFAGHTLLFIFDVTNIAPFFYFTSTYIQMFSENLYPKDVELSVDGDEMYCSKGLYISALGGLVVLCLSLVMAVPMLVIHNTTIIKIFGRFRRGEEHVHSVLELECLS